MRMRDNIKMTAIREQAIAMMVAEGMDGFSMQKLAKAANVSPATLYIYYRDREDLIMQVWADLFKEMAEAALKNFDPAMPFHQGLRIQWLNRAKYYMDHPSNMQFMEQLRHSPLQINIREIAGAVFIDAMEKFVQNAIKRKELVKVEVEVFWSVAYAPLYSLVKFHLEGKSLAGRPFKMTDKIMNETLRLVIKALTP